MRDPLRVPWALALATLALVGLAAAPPPVRGVEVVAADHPLASQAGSEVLGLGGTAIEAAVAAALAAGVVQPAGSGLGGGGFAVVRVDGATHALDFREVAPAAARADMYLDEGGAVRAGASTRGGLAVAVPGEPMGLAELARRFGKLPLAKLAEPAIRLAERGFPVGPHLAGALSRTGYPSIQAHFAVGDGVATEGQLVRRAALGRALRAWARRDGRLFEGADAEAVVRATSATGGVLTVADLEAYRPVERAPLQGRFQAWTVQTLGPPSSGGVALLQILRAAEAFDLRGMGHNSSDYVHTLTEIMKHVYADRAHHLGDPDFVDVPVQRLLSPERITAIQQAVWPSRTFEPERYGPLIAPPQDAGTHHISVVDRAGRAAALTTTINTSFGSGVLVDELGVILNNEMDDFAAAPGVPNAFGLVGNAANAIAPGKRPLSSMTPTIVLDEAGAVRLAVGASGGSFIISATAQVILNVLVFGMDPSEAVAAPRFHHQWQPDKLMVEPGFPVDVTRALEARGHVVTEQDGYSAVQAVARLEGGVEAACDPRKDGAPAGRW